MVSHGVEKLSLLVFIEIELPTALCNICTLHIYGSNLSFVTSEQWQAGGKEQGDSKCRPDNIADITLV